MNNVESVNAILEERAPLLARFLSRLGREAFFPPDIPFQAQEARGTTYNGTIGVFTDGAGASMPLPTMRQVLRLDQGDLNSAFLYSPVVGQVELRDAWARWQRGGQLCGERLDEVRGASPPSTRPVVTCGLTHGLSLAADLFGQPGRVLAVTNPFWGNYRQIFTLRTGTEVRAADAYDHGRWRPEALPELVDSLPAGEPALALVNFPANPGGYSPTRAERRVLAEGLLHAASRRPLLVLCDDAYSGLVYGEGRGEEAVPRRSFFWELAGRHENLLAMKIDGATKEFAFFGGRVGFVTFGIDLDEQAMKALENKFASLVRSTVGSPVASSQAVLLQSLRADPEGEVGEIRRVARERYDAVVPALEALDRSLLRPLPFNAGFFVLMELAPDLVGVVDPDAVRRHLIEHHDVGIVSSGRKYLRVATCSVAADMLPEMLRRVEQGVREVADQAR